MALRAMFPTRTLTAVILSVVVACSVLTPATSDALPRTVQEVPAEIRAQHSDEVLTAWIDTWWRNEYIRLWWERLAAWSAAWEARQQLPVCTGPGHDRCAVAGLEVCNGADLPPCRVVWRESRFDPSARNPRSTATGLYQFLRGTWTATCPEWPHRSATITQQVECARRLWAGGRGSSHWAQTL